MKVKRYWTKDGILLRNLLLLFYRKIVVISFGEARVTSQQKQKGESRNRWRMFLSFVSRGKIAFNR
jgi:hypothetical protein